MAQATLNKDGTPRKKGSGKTKGAGCFTRITWRQLQEYVGENTLIPVSRVWLRELGTSVEQSTNDEVEATEDPKEEIVELEPSLEPEPQVEPEPETDPNEGKDSEPIVAVTPPYRYAQDFDL